MFTKSNLIAMLTVAVMIYSGIVVITHPSNGSKGTGNVTRSWIEHRK